MATEVIRLKEILVRTVSKNQMHPNLLHYMLLILQTMSKNQIHVIACSIPGC
jgi:hypothetical protein